MPAVEVDGRTLHYEAVGDGPTVVFIHSGIADSSLWDPQVEALRDRFRVLRYDVAGYGRSPLPSGVFSHLRDLRALLTRIGIERAAFVGNSMGGRIALEYGLEYAQAAERLVLVAPGLAGHEWSAELRRADDEETARFEAGDFEGAAESQLRVWVDGPGRSPNAVDPALRDRARRMILRSYDLYAEAATNGEPGPVEWAEPPASERLAEVAAPTLIVVGEHEVPDMFDIADRLERGIRDARQVVVPGAAHLLPLERPDALNRLLVDFLAA